MLFIEYFDEFNNGNSFYSHESSDQFLELKQTAILEFEVIKSTVRDRIGQNIAI